jgi:hypothetical protein
MAFHVFITRLLRIKSFGEVEGRKYQRHFREILYSVYWAAGTVLSGTNSNVLALTK